MDSEAGLTPLEQSAALYLDQLALALEDFLPLTGSVDVRHCEASAAGHPGRSCRTVAVDTNRFPAGFNNVDPGDHGQLAAAFRSSPALQAADEIVVVHEGHTRMLVYHESVDALVAILQKAFPSKAILRCPLNELEERFGSVQRPGDSATACPKQFFLLNADLSIEADQEGDGAPDAGAVAAHRLLPMMDRCMGWDVRSKAAHFGFLHPMLEQCCARLGVPLASMQASFAVSDADVCVANPRHREHMASLVDRLAGATKAPNVFVKNDRGTYGLGLWAFSKGSELRKSNSNVLDKLSYARHGARATRFLLQEGVPSSLRCGPGERQGRPLEIVLVCIRGRVCSYFARLGAGSSTSTGSLNVPGSSFVRRQDFESSPEFAEAAELVRRHWGRYVLLGRAAMLAMAREAVWYSLAMSTPGAGLDLYAAPSAQWVTAPVEEPRADSKLPGDGPSDGTQEGSRGRRRKMQRESSPLPPEIADAMLRRLVSRAMSLVAHHLGGVSGSRVARQRFAQLLTAWRRDALKELRKDTSISPDDARNVSVSSLRKLVASFLQEILDEEMPAEALSFESDDDSGEGQSH